MNVGMSLGAKVGDREESIDTRFAELCEGGFELKVGILLGEKVGVDVREGSSLVGVIDEPVTVVIADGDVPIRGISLDGDALADGDVQLGR